ncbi:MAG: hypothetical protein WEF86_16880 [Gemmatimonadota bacterium]
MKLISRTISRRDPLPLPVALAISAAVHAGILAVPIGNQRVSNYATAAGEPSLRRPTSVTHVYDIRLSAEAGPVSVATARRQTVEVLPAPNITGAAWPAIEVEVPMPATRPASAGDGPEESDRAGRAGLDRVRARIGAALGLQNDSVARAEASALGKESARWLRSDERGRSWGLSPGRIHLGGVTLPLCRATGGAAIDPTTCGFGTTAGRREEHAVRIRMYADIQRQAARVEGDAIIADRVRAMRERQDAARDSARVRRR